MVANSVCMAADGTKSQAAIQACNKLLFTDSGVRTILFAFLLAIATVAVYYPVRSHPFTRLDDYLYIVDNPHVHNGLSWEAFKWAFTCFTMANWIPLSWLSHALDYQFFGLDPAGHHVVNVLLHALNVVLLFGVLKRATGYTSRSFMVAALFALHPMNVEPVVWVAELKTMLSMVFFLLALAAYHRYAREPRAARFRWITVLFALGLMAKPQVITLPFVLLLWDYWPLQRMFPASRSTSSASPDAFPAKSFSRLVKEKEPLLFLCGMAALIAIATQGTARPQYQPPVTLRLGNAIFSYWLYIKKFFWPSAMAPEYPYPRDLAAGQVFGALLLLLVITALVLSARRYRYLMVGWFWFLGTLVPTIGLIQVGQQALADRYTYGSYLGLFIMVCWGVADFANERHISLAWLAGGSAVVLLALTMVTYRQIGYWKNDLTLWSHAAQVVKHHWLAEDNAGVLLMQQGKSDEAMAHFVRAAAINPKDSTSNIQIGLYQQRLGHLQEAITHYQEALGDYDFNLQREDRVRVWNTMAVAYRNLGDTVNAQRCFDQARELQAQAKIAR